jgi:TetR/AcrR family transcriptional regulator, lmrAB and yxaGH operons repressor
MPSQTLTKTDTLRSSMVLTAARWLPQRGMAAINLIEVARSIEVPRGSIYHYFPGGRDQLLQEVLDLASRSGLRMIDKAASQTDTPHAFVTAILKAGKNWLNAEFSGGCPIGAAVLSAETENDMFTAALQACLIQWEAAIASALRSKGIKSSKHSNELAQAALMAFEGAMVHAKGTRNAAAFSTATRMVLSMLDNPALATS